MSFEFLSFQQVENISVLQFSFLPQNTFDYISGSSAIKQELIEVTEIDQSGSVNNILVKNNSEFYIFFSDGDILVGSKQNRVLNTSILIAPKTNLIIPVSCVERGRWHFDSKKFTDQGLFAAKEIRTEKSQHVFHSVEFKKGFYADQSQIWNSINSMFKKEFIESPSENFGDLLKKDKIKFNSLLSSFKASDEANATAIFLNDSLTSIDIYNRIDIYKEYFDKLLSSILPDYKTMKKRHEIISEDDAKSKIETLLVNPELTQNLKVKSVGLGDEERFKGKDFIGFSLIFEEHLIHKSIHGITDKPKSNFDDFDDLDIIY